MSKLEPIQLAPTAAAIVREHGQKWLTIPDVWEIMQKAYPHDAEKVREQVNTYKDPVRNNAVWFTYHICYQASKQNADLEFSNVTDQPQADVDDNAYGLIRRRGIADR